MRGRYLLKTLACALTSIPVISFASFHNMLPTSAHLCLPDVIGCEADPLMDWSPEGSNAQYYKQTTPLVKRIQLNHNAGNMIPYFGFDDSNTAAQIEFGHHVPQETNWQYLQSMVYFGGSQSGGQVLAPTPGWIHAAHQNGVKISGTIFFSPPVFGGDKEYKAFADMVTPGPLQTKIAKQLALLADTYGFDGWFINQEVQGMSAESLKGMQSFIHQVHLADPKLIVTWYDDSDPWTFLNNSINELLLDPHKDKTLYNPVFINYGWGDPQGYVDAANKINYPIANIHYGIDVPDGSNYTWQAQRGYFNRVMPKPDEAYGALTEWDYMTLITKTIDGKPGDETLNQMNQNERAFWTNGQAPMQDGASHYLPWFSAITQLPFNTYFNTGQGDDYFVDGQTQHVGNWHDIGQQDILPSWQFTASSSNKNKTIMLNYDYKIAYQGSSSLQVSADQLKPGEMIRVPLYKTNIKLTQDTVIKAVGWVNQSGVISQVCIKMNGEPQCYISQLKPEGGWQSWQHALKRFAGKTVNEIDLKLQPVGNIGHLDFHLGQLYLGKAINNTARHVLVPTVHVNCKPGLDCLSWSTFKDAVNYRVFDQRHHFVGVTHQTILAVPTTSKIGYTVEALAADGSVL